ncbi:putative bzip transcription factor protein [Daldinia childiae]|uniref:putative bzip transcription factor protein n=1 Tax=Daldinia childiae TaxID=326645 RepID=UPI001448904A|nr:putative bzip transcription factor protein [Daldinia childiae]KAF3070833.1 putative bzip transcription factor protein [Daldinia childiae]
MLLASPSFSNFLDNLSSNPGSVSQQQQPQQQQRQQQPQHEQRQLEAQVPKDVNPFIPGQQNHQHQQIGMVMMPEQTMDFSMLNSDFNYLPRVYAVLETPEMPIIDTEALAGKGSSFVESFSADAEKSGAPVLESPIEVPELAETSTEPEVSDYSVADLDGDIYDDDDMTTSSSKPVELNTDNLTAVDIFGGIEPEKAFARYELIDFSDEDTVAIMAARRVERLAASLEPVLARLDMLSIGL